MISPAEAKYLSERNKASIITREVHIVALRIKEELSRYYDGKTFYTLVETCPFQHAVVSEVIQIFSDQWNVAVLSDKASRSKAYKTLRGYRLLRGETTPDFSISCIVLRFNPKTQFSTTE